MPEERVWVTFHPQGKRIQVAQGRTLLDIARAAGIPLPSICGGDGICGRCRLVVRSGKVDAHPTTLLSRDEVQAGYVLACQTKVLGDVEVELPPEALREGKTAVDLDAQGFRAPEAEVRKRFRHDPLVKKLYLKLPPPTLEDNLGDQERLYREVRRHAPSPVLQAGLKVLRSLPKALRENRWQITVTLAQRGGTTELLQVEGGDRAEWNLGVAVDVGTSTVVAHLVDLVTGRTLDAEARYNSQAAFGEEVTRRIISAERVGVERLQQAVVGDINDLISLILSRSEAKFQDVVAVLCAGNTAMMHLLLGLDPTPLRRSPYVAAALVPPPIRAAEVGVKINPRGLLYMMPGIGGWVGGDITAGVLASGLHEAEEVSMLIDIGTNGEVVLGCREWMVACSTSAGPAFEGSGVTCGMRAGRGAIERVDIDPEGITWHTVGNVPPQGLCGSGLIDTVAGMFQAGYLDRAGRLNPSRDGVHEREGELAFLLVPAHKTGIGKDIVITQRDVENVLRAKAAIYAGANILLREMGMDFADVSRIYLAGGFGSHLDPERAICLGLVPDVPPERVRFLGNTALVGAKMALLSRLAYEEAHRIAQAITYYDLISCPYYYDEFMAAKFLPHTDLDRFPSVAGKLKLKERV